MKISNNDFDIDNVSEMSEEEFFKAFRGQFNGDLKSAYQQLKPHLKKKDKALKTDDMQTKPVSPNKTKKKDNTPGE